MKRRARNSTKRAFTLIELMLVMGMMAILAAAIGMALAQAMEQGRVARTQAQIARIHSLLMSRFDSYRTRTIRLPNGYFAPTATAEFRAKKRLEILREIMRLEMPQCIGDIVLIHPTTELPVLNALPNRYYMPPTSAYPSYSNSYFQRVQSHPSFVNGGAIESECLYLILSTIEDGDTNGLDFLLPNEIGDTDGDGVPEILDSWGRPLMFIRWAPGYVNNLALNPIPVSTLLQNGTDPDQFDFLKADKRATFALYPLIFSVGPDGGIGLATCANNHDASDPFIHLDAPYPTPIGLPMPVGGDEHWHDNITNHSLSQQ